MYSSACACDDDVDDDDDNDVGIYRHRYKKCLIENNSRIIREIIFRQLRLESFTIIQ